MSKHVTRVLPVDLILPLQLTIVAVHYIANILPQPAETRHSSLTGWASLSQTLLEEHGSDEAALAYNLQACRASERNSASSARQRPLKHW